MSTTNDFKEQIKYDIQQEKKLNDKIKSTQKNNNNKMLDVLDTYLFNNSFINREYMCYLSAAVFLAYKEYFPQFTIHINLRTKSDTSTINNIIKELKKYVKNHTDVDINISIEEDYDNSDEFDPSTITKDISGFRIIFDDINFSLPRRGKAQELFANPNIENLLNTSDENLLFIREVENFLSSPVQSGQDYYELKKNILEKIVCLTPEEFTDEREPAPSFFDLKYATNIEYNYYLEKDNFPTVISDSQLSELSSLLNDLRSRLYDPLQFAILEETLPIVYNHPLIKNVLKTSLKFDKDRLNPNGFRALYYNSISPFGFIQEIQAQSNKAFYAATKGSAYHSGMDGKNIAIEDFFELVNPNDKYDLSYYLKELDKVSADSLVSQYELPEFETEEDKNKYFSTPEGRKFIESEKYRKMMKHIKIKEKMVFEPEHISKEEISKQYNTNDPIEIEKLFQERNTPCIMDADEYLLSTALSLSPYMDVCSAGHTSFTTASIHHKKIIGEFSEVLRKKDSNTCLRDMLIRKLDTIIENMSSLDTDSIDKLSPGMKHCLKIIQIHNEMSYNLPKDISKKNIIAYGERLRNLINELSLSQKDNSNTKKQSMTQTSEYEHS